MDPLLLARIQFAANITFHILFPTIPIALGWMQLQFKLQHNRWARAAPADRSYRVAFEHQVSAGRLWRLAVLRPGERQAATQRKRRPPPAVDDWRVPMPKTLRDGIKRAAHRAGLTALQGRAG